MNADNKNKKRGVRIGVYLRSSAVPSLCCSWRSLRLGESIPFFMGTSIDACGQEDDAEE
jgi:hypothetical protein